MILDILFIEWPQQYPLIYQMLTAAGVLVLSFISYFVTKHFVLRALLSLVQRTKYQPRRHPAQKGIPAATVIHRAHNYNIQLFRPVPFCRRPDL